MPLHTCGSMVAQAMAIYGGVAKPRRDGGDGGATPPLATPPSQVDAAAVSDFADVAPESERAAADEPPPGLTYASAPAADGVTRP